MAYVPNNTNIFLAAMAGSIAGMSASTRVSTGSSDPTNLANVNVANVALAFAQAYDTVWGINVGIGADSLQVDSTKEICEAFWESRQQPNATTQFESPTIYLAQCRNLIAYVQAGENAVLGAGITPPLPPTVATPGGANTNIQYNDGGVFGGDANFTWQKAKRSLTTGSGSTATGNDALSSGVSAIASGNNSVALGGGQATAVNACAIGSGTAGPCIASSGSAFCAGEGCNSSNAATVALGEEANATGINAVSEGFANTASGTYSQCKGAFCSASATGAHARGTVCSSIRPGQDAFSSGQTGAQGKNQMDLFGVANGAALSLPCGADGSTIGWHGEQNSCAGMTVEILATTLDGEEIAREKREMLVIIDGFGSRLVNPVTTYVSPAAQTGNMGGLNSFGWSLTIAPSGNNLTFTANPGTQEVQFLAHLEWDEHYNLIATPLNLATLALTGWFESFAASPWNGTASAGTSGLNSASEVTNPPTVGAGLNGTGSALFDGVNDLLTFSGTLGTYVNAGSGSGWALVNIAAIVSAGAAFANQPIISTQGIGYLAIELTNVGGTAPKVQFSFFDGATKSISLPVPLNQWTFIAWRFDGTTMMLQVGGQQVTLAAGNLGSVANNLRMGIDTGSANFYNGQILDLGLSMVALTNLQLANVRVALNLKYQIDL